MRLSNFHVVWCVVSVIINFAIFASSPRNAKNVKMIVFVLQI